MANTARVQFGTHVKGKGPRMAVRGRVCQTDGCTTVLSVYNKSEACSMHEYRTLSPGHSRL